ncbi:MAG: trypsin-like serine peptidase [Myxococcales bacterium]
MTVDFRAALAALLLAGCAGAEATVDEPAAPETDPEEALWSNESKVIVGSVDWKSTTTLDPNGPEARNAKAVGYLSIPAKGTRCTAWLIANDKVVTNNHCIANAEQAVGARVSFNYEDGVSSTQRIWWDCSGFVKSWTDVDATVLTCKARDGKLPGQVYGTVALASANAATNASIYVLHQNCDYYTTSGCSPTKKYSPGYVKNGSYSTTQLTYTADTLGGSSGSAVFIRTGTYAHKLVALHNLGFGGDENGRGTQNGGIKVLSLKKRLAEVGL